MAFGNTLSRTVQKYLNLHSLSASEQFSNNNKSERSQQIVSDKLSLMNCKLEASEDLCNVAFPVYVNEYGRHSSVIASVIKNQPSKQSAIFIFTRSQNSELNQTSLTLRDLILLNDEFSCEVDEPDHIYITGRRWLLNNCHQNNVSINEDLNHKTQHNASFKNNNSNINYDSESILIGHMNSFKHSNNNIQLKVENGKSQSRINNSYTSTQLTSLLLEFFNSNDTLEFYQIIIQYFIKSSNSLSVPELTLIQKNQIHFYLNDDLIQSADNLQDQFNWLNKYLDKDSFELASNLQDSYSLLVSDSSSINENKYDYLKPTSTCNKTNSCPSLDNSKLSAQNKYTKVKRHTSKRLFKVRRCQSSVSPPPTKLKSKPPKPMKKNSLAVSQNNWNNSSDSLAETCLTSPHSFSDLRFANDSWNKCRFTKPWNNILTNSTINYPKYRKISVFIGTWNVNGRNGSNLNLDDWLIPPEGQPPADLYVIGLQELDLRLKVITLNKTSSSGPEDLWIQQLEEALGGLLKPPTSKSNVTRQNETESIKNFAAHWFQYTGGGYIRIRRVRLAGIMMIVYISAKLSIHLRHDEISQHIVPTGVLNVLGNKGGVSLRLTIFNTSLCFVNCHLAAGKEKIDRRNQDFKEIVRKMSLLFPINPKRLPFPMKKSYISVHDVIFLFGDLNYRITGLDSDNVRRLVRQNNYVSLLKNDELSKELNSRKIFQGFREHKITFPPTYKFDINCQTYDSSEKYRIPAYCDRIIWFGRGCTPIAYRSHPNYICSDHKPISGYFLVEVSLFDTFRYDYYMDY
uniref:Putative ocrl type II inositol 5-phosphatase n=2 Tax=Schistosoma mansoni TaxID=6183 RepID=A0A5K4ESV2_SCHMA